MNVTLHLADYAALSPLLILLGGALILLLMEAFAETAAKKFSFPLAFATTLIALYAVIYGHPSDNALLTPWLRFDTLAQFFAVLFLSIGLISMLLSEAFFQHFENSQGEYYFLLIASLFGLLLIGAAADFLTLFLGLETLSISLYILCGYMKSWKIAHEAAVKYFLMGAVAAAILLYGIALVYGAVGTTRLDALLAGYQGLSNSGQTTLFLAGIALITVGFAFKAALVPFHVWAPDVYDGAPTPVTAFMAVGTKAGAFAAFALLFLVALPHFNELWNQAVAWLAYPTLLYANLVAMRQNQLRRFFAYSGISNSGFLLIPLAAQTPDALSALLFYLVVYVIATLGCFAVLAYLDKSSEGVMLKDLRGLFRRDPVLATVLTLALLTLAGIPPTAGFFAKFYLFKQGFEAGYYVLVIVALLTTILSAFYYLRIVSLMLAEAPVDDKAPTRSWPAALVGLVTIAAVLMLSVYPQPVISMLSGVGR